MNQNLPTFLHDKQKKLLLFGGKGGVGKTSCAASTALFLAARFPQCRYLLVSTDPAHSLKDSLSNTKLPDNLELMELDAQSCLDNFKSQHEQKLREIAARGTFLDNDDISQFLNLTLPGLDELMAFFEITKWTQEEKYSCIVVDTAPTGHTLRLLGMPLFFQRWLGMLDALLAKHRYMKELFAGARKKDELDTFIADLKSSLLHMEGLLHDPALCRFVPVMLSETLSINETNTLVAELVRLHIPVSEIIVNRLYPANDCSLCLSAHVQQRNKLEKSGLAKYHLWGVPMYPFEVSGAQALDLFWQSAEKLEKQPSVIKAGKSVPVIAQTSAQLPLPYSKLLLFAGKGGVGKTTMACATAIRLSREYPDKKVLLFSLDPAHSLSDCLDVAISSTPTPVCPGLTAIEIDAQAEFDLLKQEYQQELKTFLAKLAPNMDFTFDRKVMERVLDLSPPGLDEIMAMNKVVEYLDKQTYDIFVLDTAPTGHLIRFLELPELVDQWLKVFFGLFLKYKQVFRLPKITERLIQLSRGVKLLRKLLTDKNSAALYPVSILTEMAFCETTDLMAACQRLKINAPTMFLNLHTPLVKCSLCAATHQREEKIKAKFQKAFPDQEQVLISKGSEVRGVSALGNLGQALFLPPLVLVKENEFAAMVLQEA